MLIALPILIPLWTAALCMLLSAWASLQRVVATAGAFSLLVAAMALLVRVWGGDTVALHVGGWGAPIGITLIADLLAALLVTVVGVMHAAVTVYSLVGVDRRQQRRGYFTFLNVLLMGVCGAFLTGDLFNLYVWFEVMLMGSFVLLVLGGERAQLAAGLKYVTLSLLSSALFLAGIGVIYGVAHTLNMAHLSVRLAEVAVTHPWLVVATSVLLLLAFGIKAAMFPLHFWLPESYHTPAPAVSAIFAGLLTKVGVYALLRVFGMVIPGHDYVFTLLLVTAGATMLLGVLGAVAQTEIRKVLSFHIISQIGYMVFGVGLLSHPDAEVRLIGVAAAIFYIVHHIVVKTNLFLIGGMIRAWRGTERLAQLGGLFGAAPWLAVLFLIPALSLAGIPPLSGFWAKLAIIRAGVAAEHYVLTFIALLAGLLTLVSMLKLWNEAFWKPASDTAPTPSHVSRRVISTLIVPCVALALITVAIGLYPQPLLKASRRAAEKVLDRSGYVAAMGLPMHVEAKSGDESEDAP